MSVVTRVQFFAVASRGSATKSSVAADEETCKIASIEVGGRGFWLSALELVKKACIHYGWLAYRAETSVSLVCLRLWVIGPSIPMDNIPG